MRFWVCSSRSRERAGCDQTSLPARPSQRVAERATVAGELDAHHVAIDELDSRAEAQAGRAEEMHVQVPRAAVRRVLEVVMLDVGEAMAHGGLARSNAALPKNTPAPLDPHRAGDRAEIGVDHQLGTEAAAPELRSG